MKTALIVPFAMAAVLGVGLTSAAALIQPPAGAGQGAQLFDAKCKTCHEPSVGRAPALADLRQRTPENIVEVLTKGSMATMAQGLSPDMIRQIAVYVSGKPMAPAVSEGQSSVAAGAQPPGKPCAVNPPIQPAATDWNGFGKDSRASRYQTGTTITAANVDRLKVKWSFSLAGGRHGQPTVIGNHLFLTTFAGDAFSIDADTGCVHWRASLGAAARVAPFVARLPGVTPSGWVVFVGDNNRDVHALDAMTGADVWKTNIESHPLSMITGSPVVHDGVVYVPVSSSEETTGTTASYPCCTFAGSVVALDARSGKQIWKTKLLEPKPTRKNSAGTQLSGPAGAAIWSQPTIDAKRGQLYVATGDSYTEISEPASDSVVAMDLKTGAIRWMSQVTEDDNFLIGCGPNPARRGANCPTGEIGPDHDFGASPILQTLPNGRQLVLAGQKSGVAWGLNPDTGKVVWETAVGAGSALGGIEWGMAADNRRLYVTISDAAAGPDKAKPGVYALNPATGAFIWKSPAPAVPCSWPTRRCSAAQSSPPTVIPGVVFSGGQDGWLRAYSSSTGRTLWMFDSAARTYQTANGVAAQPGGSFDHTGFVVSGDRLFAISGYNGATGAYGNPLNVLVAFTLDGK